MKKAFKILMAIISLFVGINIVKADRNCDDIVMYANSDFYSRTGVYMTYADYDYNYSLYTLKNASGAAFSSYCRNAGISAGKSYNGEKFKCKQVVFDTTTSNETRKTYDAGIVEILKNGYSTRNPIATKLENNQEYAATNLALRTYEMLWPDINTNGTNATGTNKAHQYYANKWLDDPEIQSLLKQSVGSVRSKYSNATTVTSWRLVSNGTNVTTAIEEEGRRLVKLGLKAAADYKKNGAATLKWNDKPTKQKAPTITDAKGVTKYETALTYVFTASKFKSQGAYIYMSFDCSECSKYGVDYTIYVNDKEVGKTIAGNLLPSGGDGKIIVKIVFKSDSTKYDYGEVPYTLNVAYYDESISTEAYDMYSSGCYSNTSCQHFYMLYADDVAQTAKIKNTIELNTINCTDLEYLCKNEKDSHACDMWDKLYNKTCADCQAYVNNAVCTNADSNISISEGHDFDSKTCTGSQTANVMQCIIGQSDQNGNTYQATNLVSNKYCSVWCKEDYYFTLPGNKEANSGRYFTLQASISGTKTCYTTEIKKQVFENDYEAARKEVIKAYNNWALYDAAVNNHGTNLITNNPQPGAVHYSHKIYSSCTGTDGKAAGSCGKAEKHDSHWYLKQCNGNNAISIDGFLNGCGSQYEHAPHMVQMWCSGSDGKAKIEAECGSSIAHEAHQYENGLCPGNEADDYYNYKYIWSFKAYDTNGQPLSSVKGLEYDTDTTSCTVSRGIVTCTYLSKGSSSCTHTSCSSTNGKDISEVYTESGATSKASTLNSKINTLNTTLKNYNNCSSWSMSYNFEPEIHFWYEESYMNDAHTDILAVSSTPSKSGVNIQRCESDITDQTYSTCPTGWTSKSLLKDIDKFLCYKENDSYTCGVQTVKIGQTIRMKENINASGSYITPTQFYTIYPSGSIAIASPGASIDNAEELTNKLPIGLGTAQGVYNYTLVIKNLGEYYNSGKLGRIWGDNDSIVSTTLKENAKCYPNGALKYEVNIDGKASFEDGVYNCAYRVNCPNCPVECAPDGCENPDCPENNCPVDCDNCIYTNNNTDVNYRPITPDDLNPNDRELGKNWEFNDQNIQTAIELKAYATTKEIEDLGETIYDMSFDNPDSSNNFAMKVTMDTTMISRIRAYNDKYENTYGYLNNSLKCYDYENSADNVIYKNIFCYSELIDELLTDSDTKDNIKITVERPLSEAERKNYNPGNGYFTTWTLADGSKWNIKTAYGFSINDTKKGYGTSVNIGPSWK